MNMNGWEPPGELIVDAAVCGVVEIVSVTICGVASSVIVAVGEKDGSAPMGRPVAVSATGLE
jgi:hypothetical protein